MPKAVTSTWRRFVHTLREFTVGQRTLAIIGLAVLVVGTVGLTAWLSAPTYSPLFTSLSASDAGSITQLLHTDNVPYQLSDGGATIMVPEEDVDAERLKAASAGLPSLSQDGYGLLDKLGVTASQFQETTTWQRALEGELANTIEGMNGVETASVKLAIPTQSVFESQQTPTTASVFIRTTGGQSLGTSQVQAITHLTAASVNNLKPENVSVISADGTLLSGSSSTAATSASSGTTYESRVQSNIQTMLDRVLGAGNSTVVVAADLSQDTSTKVSQTYAVPTNAPAINEQSSTETYGGANGSTATGVLGPDNIAVPSDSSTNGAYVSQSSTKNNAVNSTTETTKIPAGELTRQTVSVAVNTAAVKGVSASTIEKLVDGAAGVNVKRGDTVDVQMVPFSKTSGAAAGAALKQQSGQETQSSIMKIAGTGVIVLGVLLGLFLILRFFGALSKRREDTPIDIGPIHAEPILPTQRELDSEASAFLEAAASSSPQAIDPAAPNPIADLDRMRANIDRLAAADPSRAAEHLRSLMDGRVGV
ncbi:MAG TPA: flagellar basal-body MS-ring/collar protein FliF [Galbitalea sp.]|jgi:flagellar M-ring protein FliF